MKLFAAIKRANRTSGIDSPVTIWRAYNKIGKNQIERQGEREADRERERGNERDREREREREGERERNRKRGRGRESAVRTTFNVGVNTLLSFLYHCSNPLIIYSL